MKKDIQMADMIAGWQTLAPGNLPTKHLALTFSDFDPKKHLAAFDFAGFVDMESSTEISYYQDVYSADRSVSITGRNYYGPLFFIQINTNSIEIEDYCLRDEQCQETSMRLLNYLACELKLKFQWQGYSWYYDNHEHSDFRKGSEQEICALFA